MLPRRIAVLCVPALLAFPAAASAEPFKDYLIPDSGPTARAAQVQGTTQDYATADGTLIPVTLAASYTGDPAIAQTYATFLGTLPHGPSSRRCGSPSSPPRRSPMRAASRRRRRTATRSWPATAARTRR